MRIHLVVVVFFAQLYCCSHVRNACVFQHLSPSCRVYFHREAACVRKCRQCSPAMCAECVGCKAQKQSASSSLEVRNDFVRQACRSKSSIELLLPSFGTANSQCHTITIASNGILPHALIAVPTANGQYAACARILSHWKKETTYVI